MRTMIRPNRNAHTTAASVIVHGALAVRPSHAISPASTASLSEYDVPRHPPDGGCRLYRQPPRETRCLAFDRRASRATIRRHDMLEQLLIANRGEVAVRVAQA